MTGNELKQFVKDQGWTVDQALEFFGIGRMTLYDNYKKEEVTGPIAKCCELYLFLPQKHKHQYYHHP